MQVMIEEHISHPSIVMWVVFNEGWGQYETERVTRLARSLDSSRLVNCASGWHAPNLHLLPLCGIQPPSRPLMGLPGASGKPLLLCMLLALLAGTRQLLGH